MKDPLTITVEINEYSVEKIPKRMEYNFDHPRGVRTVIEFHDGDSIAVKPEIAQEIFGDLWNNQYEERDHNE
jgi:hypothetical protein